MNFYQFTLTQTYNHASIPPLSFLQTGCLTCHPANSVKAPKAKLEVHLGHYKHL